MRAIPVLLVTAGLVASLTACVSDPSYTDCAAYESGEASSLIEAAGEFGATPTISFPTPIVTTTAQSEQLIEGDGEKLQVGQPARVELSLYNGTTGAEIQSTAYDGRGYMTMVGESDLPAVGKALECATVGSRIVLAAPAKDALTEEALAKVSVKETDSFVFVIDVLDGYLAKANGTPQSPTPGLPVVVTAPDGSPGITVPRTGGTAVEPPADLAISVLRRGDGEEIEQGKLAILQYTGVLWNTNEVFDSSWPKNQAAVFPMDKESVIDGFLDGLTGQTVGSQVLLVIPPELGYGDTGNGSVPSGATLVFVVDILGQISSQ